MREKMIVVYSEKDPAGSGIAKRIKEAGGIEVVKLNSELLFCEKEIEEIKDAIKNVDYIIFASKHKSETVQPCFTVHTPGNWGHADAGGKDNQLCISVPSRMKTIIMNINHHVELPKLKGWKVSMECTHHGPLIEIPCFFVEIGSSVTEWNNDIAHKIVAESIIDHTFKPYKWPVAFGIGGGHYCPKFTKYELAGVEGNPFAFGHVLPNYKVDSLNFETFIQGIEKNTEKVENILIDWKGLKKEQRDKILNFLEKTNLTYKRV